MRAILALVILCVLSPLAAVAQTFQPGDSIGVSVLQDSKLDRQVLVDRAGFIALPLVGRIKAAGMTPQALETLLKNRLRPNYTTDLDVTVSLVTPPNTTEEAAEKEQKKPKIFVTGEVKSPGSFVYKPQTNVLQAIALSGGLGPFAAKTRIQIHRRVEGLESVFVFDYRAYEAGRVLEGNIDLRPNDVIVVPEKGFFE